LVGGSRKTRIHSRQSAVSARRLDVNGGEAGPRRVTATPKPPGSRTTLRLPRDYGWAHVQAFGDAAQPLFPDLAPQVLVITNSAGAIALKLTCLGDPGENTIVRGSAPLSQGRETCRDFRVLGTCPAAVAGSADITALYTTWYGVPRVCKKVYVQVNQFIDGWESQPTSFWAIVPDLA
jgi:hypothetical protein